jgi:hypothetical protein
MQHAFLKGECQNDQLSQIPAADDTIACAMKSVKEHCNVYQGKAKMKDGRNPARITWSSDLMVIKVTKEEIFELRGEINDYEFGATVNLPEEQPNPPKYSNADGTGNPYAQIDTTKQIPSWATVATATTGRMDIDGRDMPGAKYSSWCFTAPYGQKSIQNCCWHRRYAGRGERDLTTQQPQASKLRWASRHGMLAG